MLSVRQVAHRARQSSKRSKSTNEKWRNKTNCDKTAHRSRSESFTLRIAQRTLHCPRWLQMAYWITEKGCACLHRGRTNYRSTRMTPFGGNDMSPGGTDIPQKRRRGETVRKVRRRYGRNKTLSWEEDVTTGDTRRRAGGNETQQKRRRHVTTGREKCGGGRNKMSRGEMRR